jgi:O-antigen/teichoic acid export membrane protein
VPSFKLVNLKGDLFATAFCFGAQAVIKLGSSLILTRILNPEAYGIIAIIVSIAFVVELIGDINVTLFIVRDNNGEQPRYLNTARTMNLARGALNTTILFLLAPFISTSLYDLPALTIPLRVFSLTFVISALQTMAFPVAIRRKRARIIMYSELAATAVSTVFSLVYCYYSRDFWGIVFGMLLSRLTMTVLSYQFYPELRPKLHFDWAAARDILGFSKFVMPSSLLTIAISQFDKIVFLRLFDLNLLGVYGLAGNIAGPIEALISKISQSVLYPRCAHNFRANRETFALMYYTENVKLFFSILILPAAVGGAAQLVIAVLYPSRYAEAGAILQAFMVRAALLSLASPAEDLLIATGEYQVGLYGNVFRAIWVCAGSLGGYYLFGFMGFVYGAALSGLPPLLYYVWLQRKKGMLIAKYEAYKLAFVLVVALSSYVTSTVIAALWPTLGIRS